jgi:hypothetical protein
MAVFKSVEILNDSNNPSMLLDKAGLTLYEDYSKITFSSGGTLDLPQDNISETRKYLSQIGINGVPFTTWEEVSGSSVAWGDITGDITDQTDLIIYINDLVNAGIPDPITVPINQDLTVTNPPDNDYYFGLNLNQNITLTSTRTNPIIGLSNELEIHGSANVNQQISSGYFIAGFNGTGSLAGLYGLQVSVTDSGNGDTNGTFGIYTEVSGNDSIALLGRTLGGTNTIIAKLGTGLVSFSAFTSYALVAMDTVLLSFDVLMPGLPTSDPHIVGQLWNSSGTVHISAG